MIGALSPAGGAGTESAPQPLPASPAYFALLYSPAPRRATVRCMLALADELDAGISAGREHTLVHARLDWWRLEAERFQRGAPQHPWLRSLQSQAPETRHLHLSTLVDAALADLAARTMQVPPGGALRGALFVLLAEALGVDVHSDQLRRELLRLGQLAQDLDHGMAARDPKVANEALAALAQRTPAIAPALQSALTPVLVWVALLARRARRRQLRAPAAPPSRFDGVADNLLAWRIARRAARGRARLD